MKIVAKAKRVNVDRGDVFQTLDVAVIVVRQLTGLVERPCDLQKAEAHQVRAKRNAQVDDPQGQLEVRRCLIGVSDLPDVVRTQGAHDNGEQRAREQAEEHVFAAQVIGQPIDQHVDADVNAGPDAVRGAELGHPDEHVDAKLLRPGEIKRQQPILKHGNWQAGSVPVYDG